MKHSSKLRLGAIFAPLSDGGALAEILKFDSVKLEFRSIDGAHIVNATQMAKSFKKRPAEWLRLPNTQEFIKATQQRTKKRLIYTRIGGRNYGCTYLHEDIAIEFARWLSSKYVASCYANIKGLIERYSGHPQTPTNQALTIDDLLGRLREATDLVVALKRERAERERLEAVLSGIKRQIDGLPPKSERMVITQSTLFSNL